MAEANSVIHLTDGRPITVPLGLHELRGMLAEVEPEEPFIEVSDTDGGRHLINANQIVSVQGAG